MKDTTKLYSSSSFNRLVEVEAGHWWFRSRNRILLWVLKKYAGIFESFLEIGCGTGFVLQAVQEHFPLAVLQALEYFEEGLEHARKRVPSADFIQQDARKMTYNERFDCIGAFDVIEHIEEDELVFSNLFRALKNGGTLLVTVPQHRWLWSAVDERACHKRRYIRSELIKKVEQSGLKVEYVTSFVTILIPLMLLSRLQAKTDKPIDEFRISSWLNGLFSIFMSVELGLLKMGLTFPFGGSLLLLAKK